jgi:hypothetical protein
MTNVYPKKVFCSATCVIRKYEAEHHRGFKTWVCDVSPLSPEVKRKIFDPPWQHLEGLGDAKSIIARIKKMDDQIGQRFLERVSLIENNTVRMAMLSSNKLQNFAALENTTSSIGPFASNTSSTAIRRIQQVNGHIEGGVSSTSTTPNSADIVNSFSSFIAVSYCWHNQEWEPVPSLQDENTSSPRRAPVSQKMLDAINVLRQDDSEGVWIDQLCINQDESTEKRTAIASMDIIYSNARLVVIVLEDVELTRDELRAWRKLREHWYAAKTRGTTHDFAVGIDTATSVMKTLNKLSSTRWLKRAWCFQEYLLSKRCVFLVPCEGHVVMISPNIFQRTLDYRRGIPAGPMAETYNLVQGFTYKRTTEVRNRPISDLLVHLHLRHALVLADKLSLLINIYGMNLAYDGTQMTADQFCYTCIVLALVEGDISVLCHSGPQLVLESSEGDKSWARWPLMDRISDHGHTPRSNTFTIKNPYVMFIDLYFLNGPIAQPSSASMEIARDFLQTTEFTTLLNFLTLKSRGSSRHFVKALAIGLDCGMQWIISISRKIYGVQQKQWGLDRAFHENRSRSSQVYMQLTKQMLPDSHVGEEVGKTAEHLLKFVLILLAHELPLQIARPVTSTGSPAGFTPNPPKCVVAVPQDLANARYLSRRRVWFLERASKSSESGWKVVGKGIMFNMMDLKEEHGFVELRRQQRIVG